MAAGGYFQASNWCANLGVQTGVCVLDVKGSTALANDNDVEIDTMPS